MHIEFSLPKGASGQATSFSSHLITQSLLEWGAKRKILYKTRIEDYTYKVFLENPGDYSIFVMTWNSKGLHSLSWKRITIVDEEPK